ncbi:hypothetical protein JHK87_016920 [Glycine soja]|nr:hypothetical protein JHK87_016920 [Glycine soja]
MPPRKKKLNLQQQQQQQQQQPPSKFGIQHFFERASQKQQHLQPHTTTTTTTANAPPPEEQQPPNEVSPQTRFKFSPGMLVKQSQDEVVDEVTWKISPVNERLQAVSKYTPEVIKALAASSKINLSPIRSSGNKETCLDKVITSPNPKVPLSFKRISSARDVSGQSPFRTPPSYRPDKALLELLDQVEDAIAVDDVTVCNNNTYSFKVPQDLIANELPVKVNPTVERTKSDIPKEVVDVFSSNYLVLEVLRLLNEQTGEERAVNLHNEWKEKTPVSILDLMTSQRMLAYQRQAPIYSLVIDIEEMAWAPKYGLKGMIDASVRVKIQSQKDDPEEKIMPLEYQKAVDSGLLYYLRSDQTQGIVVQRSDLTGLIMRRNELASDLLKALTLQQLPPMLQAHGGSTESSGLGEAFDSLSNHMTSSHSKFLCRWDRLIDLEAKETELLKKGVLQSHRLNSGGLSSIVLDASQGIPHQKSLNDNKFVYHFIQQDSSSSLSGVFDASSSASLKNDLDFTLRSGDHVVSFSKRLRIPGSSSTAHDLSQQVWRIDKDEYVTSFAIMRFNLVQLFLQNDQSAHLRRMIVDLEAPRFDSGSLVSQDPAISYVWSEKSLNDDQRGAILKGIDFVRIGRHEVVNEEVREHCLSAMNVQGVEDIKIRLEQVKVVAVTCLGISSPLLANTRFDVCIMDEAGQTTLPYHPASRCRLGFPPSPASLQPACLPPCLPPPFYPPPPLFLVWDLATLLAGYLHEVSLGPLIFASTFVLVGDHYQLPPLVQSAEARENGMGISLFCRLSEAHPEAISALQSQDIMDLSNALIYGDRLRCGSFEVANSKLEFSGLNCDLPWLEDLPALEARDQKIVNNPIEAQIIAEVAKELVKNGIGSEHIGIITPYNSQANLIRNAASMTSLEIHTIDKYQGRDKDCILVSFVRSTENPTSCAASLLGDWHRINVALTRAKKKLIMVGSRRTLLKVPLLKLLIKKVEEQSGILTVTKKDIYRKSELKRCSQMR